MKIYFIRHGESEGNVTEVHNDDSVMLTDKGREQAKFLAQRVTYNDIAHLAD